jgi:hypothetical protein
MQPVPSATGAMQSEYDFPVKQAPCASIELSEGSSVTEGTAARSVIVAAALAGLVSEESAVVVSAAAALTAVARRSAMNLILAMDGDWEELNVCEM